MKTKLDLSNLSREKGDEYRSSSFSEIVKKELEVRLSEWTKFAFLMFDKDENKYKNFSFNGREFWIPIYDSPCDKILCKCGRQVNKSTWLGNVSICYSCLQPNFKTLYVSPSQMQTKEWMKDRIIGAIDDSNILRKYKDRSGIDNTLVKQFITNSEILFRYAFLNANRIRGIAGIDLLIIDEVQHIIKDNIPIIEQVSFAASKRYKKQYYSGTPLSLDNPIEDFWQNQSSQNEWAIPCHRHSKSAGGKVTNKFWNIITDERNIGSKGLICTDCGGPISARDPECHWVSLNPRVWREDSGVAKPFQGFHIPQLISPDCDWKTLLHYRSTYHKAQFYNEVLGVSYDSGEKPITRQDMIDNCDSNEDEESRISLNPNFQDRMKSLIFDGRPIFAGLDWGAQTEKSYTVLTIATYVVDRGKSFFVPFYWKRFEGPEAESTYMMKNIIRILHDYRVRYIGSDFGGGMMQNDSLQREFGHTRVIKYQYSNPKTKIKWEPNLGRFVIHRSECMSALFTAIKRKDVFRFPRWEDFEKPFGQDFLAITSEYNPRTRLIAYQKNPANTDDSFHALLYAFLASFMEYPRRDILNPDTKASYGEDFSMEYGIN